ncbi:MAG: lysophospholipid acyltransferase family protein [Ornithinimicrobium sp.]
MSPSGDVARRPGALRLPGQVLLTCFDQFVRLSLKGVWVRGDIPSEPVVWAMNHHHWWDAFASASVLRTRGQRPTALVSDRNLASFGVLNWIDAVPAGHSERAEQLLRAGRTLIIMPEGRMMAPGPLGPLRGGAGRIAAKAEVPLVPVALRVVMRGSQHAEAFIDIGAPVRAEELAPALGQALRTMDDTLATADPTLSLPGYRCVVTGRGSVDGWISVMTPWRR